MPDPTHECPCGCGAQIERDKLACKRGWFRLPADLRHSINQAYRLRHSVPAAHSQVLAEALAWYRDNPIGGRP